MRKLPVNDFRSVRAAALAAALPALLGAAGPPDAEVQRILGGLCGSTVTGVVRSDLRVSWECAGHPAGATAVRRYGIWWLDFGIPPTPSAVQSSIPTTIAPDPASADGYRVVLRLQTAQAGIPLRFGVRMPAESESWAVPHGNAEMYFSLENTGTATLIVGPDSEILVCYPFLMRSGYHHALSLAPVQPVIAPYDLRVRDNCLEGSVPAFTLPGGSEAFGEVDGDPSLSAR